MKKHSKAFFVASERAPASTLSHDLDEIARLVRIAMDDGSRSKEYNDAVRTKTIAMTQDI